MDLLYIAGDNKGIAVLVWNQWTGVREKMGYLQHCLGQRPTRAHSCHASNVGGRNVSKQNRFSVSCHATGRFAAQFEDEGALKLEPIWPVGPVETSRTIGPDGWYCMNIGLCCGIVAAGAV
mmetsp:Transcript_26822/g.40020  ORF Transcript_26822/g.40020 Transcript_26822/m.40020 type:complete len:121 (+) Transcript_26822:49-411(+)